MRIIIIWCAMLCGCAGSGMTPQTVAAVALSTALDRIGEALVNEYAKRDAACIVEAPKREIAVACLDKLDTSWRPVWASWEGMRRLHGRWATALEQGYGEEPQLAQLLGDAFCDVRGATAAAGAALPLLEEMPLPCPEATK